MICSSGCGRRVWQNSHGTDGGHPGRSSLMGRPVMLGNGSLTVGLNEAGLVHDFYYPYVGLDNLTTARSMDHKIGVWVDGQFSWVDGKDWQVKVDFEQDALVSDVVMANSRLGVTLS